MQSVRARRVIRAAALLAGLLFAGSLPAQETADDTANALATTDLSVLQVRDPTVQTELGLTADQQQTVVRLMDEADARLWRLRDGTMAQAGADVAQVLARAQGELDALLNAGQQQRFVELRLRLRGLSALLDGDLAERVGLSAGQKQQIESIVSETRRDLAAVQARVSKGESGTVLDAASGQLHRRGEQRIRDTLNTKQRSAWAKLLGSAFDVTKVRPLAARAPELIEGDAWINSGPLTLIGLRGRVVVVHFWTFGCANCIHNYPHYKAWQETLAPQGLTIIGIHTPETPGERDVEAVRRQVQQQGLTFPVLVDNARANWEAWANHMWPSVYVLDKSGYVRYWWYGELNWQGAQGEKYLRQRIEELLGERP